MISPLLLNKPLPDLLNIGSVTNLGSEVVEGDPQASVAMIHGEPTDNLTCGIFACTKGKFKWFTHLMKWRQYTKAQSN